MNYIVDGDSPEKFKGLEGWILIRRETTKRSMWDVYDLLIQSSFGPCLDGLMGFNIMIDVSI